MSTLPNTQPIYTKDIINWAARLTTQVAGRKLTVESPVYLGNFGPFGGLIWSIRAVPLGANVATNLRIYGAPGAESSVVNFRLLFEVPLPSIPDSATNGVNIPVGITGNSVLGAPTPIEVPLPRIYSRNTDESRGLVREGNYALYCALSTAVAGGWDVHVEGGNY
jgi:hypothetical protein